MSIQELLDRIVAEVRSAWRFRWYGAAVAWLICMLGWAWAVSQPNVYEASARVFVDSSSVLRPVLGEQVVRSDVETQLAYVRQELLGRAHLEHVVQENDLDLAVRNEEQREALLAGLRERIRIDSRGGSNTLYSISYRHSQRDKAVAIVSTLLNSLVEATMSARAAGTVVVDEFLERQILDLENRLQQAELERATFKTQNAGRLPGAEGGIGQRIANETAALEAAEKALRRAESTRARLLEQLNSEDPVALSAGAAQIQPAPGSLDARIRDYQAQLDALLLRYFDSHPEVRATREAMEELQRQRAAQLQSLGVSNPDQELTALEANPVYQQLRIQLNTLEVDIEGLRVDVRDRQEKLASLKAAEAEVYAVETQLAQLNRDYETMYASQQRLIQQRETQRLSQEASNADDVEFRVIDPPLAAYDPVAPDRVLLLAGVLVMGLGGAGALCWLLAQLRPVFSTVGSLRTVTGLPVLGVVSEAAEAGKALRRRVSLLAYASVMGGLVVVFLAAVVVESAGPGLQSLMGMA